MYIFNYRGNTVKSSGGIPIVLTLLLVGFLYLLESFDLLVLHFSLGVATLAFIGMVDDIFGKDGPKGFKGHISSLCSRDFVISTGMVKAIWALFLVIPISVSHGANISHIAMDTILMIFSINLLNLLDCRPGRACKFFLLASALGLGLIVFQKQYYLLKIALPSTAATLVFLKYDIGEELMLGDVGSNVLGFCIGLIFTQSSAIIVKSILVVFVSMINVIAEHYSLSDLIEDINVLNYVDSLGRKKT